jgi:hypothetical protein
MDVKELSDDVDQLLAALQRLPAEELQIVQWLVNELLERPDDDEHRSTAVSTATTRLSAIRSV